MKKIIRVPVGEKIQAGDFIAEKVITYSSFVGVKVGEGFSIFREIDEPELQLSETVPEAVSEEQKWEIVTHENATDDTVIEAGWEYKDSFGHWIKTVAAGCCIGQTWWENWDAIYRRPKKKQPVEQLELEAPRYRRLAANELIEATDIWQTEAYGPPAGWSPAEIDYAAVGDDDEWVGKYVAEVEDEDRGDPNYSPDIRWAFYRRIP